MTFSIPSQTSSTSLSMLFEVGMQTSIGLYPQVSFRSSLKYYSLIVRHKSCKVFPIVLLIIMPTPPIPRLFSTVPICINLYSSLHKSPAFGHLIFDRPRISIFFVFLSFLFLSSQVSRIATQFYRSKQLFFSFFTLLSSPISSRGDPCGGLFYLRNISLEKMPYFITDSWVLSIHIV